MVPLCAGRQSPKASPARSCEVERRLRRIQRDGAGTAVAEHKRASARAVRCGHRKPDGGCAARRRRRGTLPACGGDILQTLAGPCPVSVGDDACIVPETRDAARLRGGRNRPPYKAPAIGRRCGSGSCPPSPPTGRCKHRPLRRGATLHDCHPPVVPAVPGCAGRTPYIVGRAFSPAGGLAASRKDIGGARHRTPQSADADSSPCRGAFQAAVPPKPPLQGEVDAP